MFHKIVSADFARNKAGIPVLLLTLAMFPSERSMAQGDLSPYPEGRQEIEQEPIPVPIRSGDEKSLGDQTFIDDVFQSTRNHWGFSLSAYQAYISDVSTDSESRGGSGITAFMPRTFFNLGKRKSRLHFDLGAGYRHYNRHKELNSWDYYGDAQYSYRLSKKTTFQLADQFTSSYNDAYSFVSLYSPIDYDFDFSNEVIFNRQRINRNSLRAGLDFQPSRKNRLNFFGGYNAYRYSRNSLDDSDAIEIGASWEYQLTKWFSISNSYSAYQNHVTDSLRDTRIHRTNTGFFISIANSWRFHVGGGITLSEYQEDDRANASVNTGISYTSETAAFSLTYQRGFTTGIGISRLLNSDVVAGNLGYRINRWLNARFESYYYRSSEEHEGGILETLSGGGGLEFSLRRDIFLTMNAYYQNQKTRSFPVEGLGLNRFAGYLGIQYVWPARRRSDN